LLNGRNSISLLLFTSDTGLSILFHFKSTVRVSPFCNKFSLFKVGVDSDVLFRFFFCGYLGEEGNGGGEFSGSGSDSDSDSIDSISNGSLFFIFSYFY